jgi:hypothetical protein
MDSRALRRCRIGEEYAESILFDLVEVKHRGKGRNGECAGWLHRTTLATHLWFSTVDAERAGMAKPEPSPRYVRLLRKEYVSLFQLGHNIGVPLDFAMTNAFALDHLCHTNEVGWQALKCD